MREMFKITAILCLCFITPIFAQNNNENQPSELTLTIDFIGKGEDIRIIVDNETTFFTQRDGPRWSDGLKKLEDIIKKSDHLVLVHSDMRFNFVYESIEKLRSDVNKKITFVDRSQIEHLDGRRPVKSVLVCSNGSESFCLFNGKKAKSTKELIKFIKSDQKVAFITLIKDKTADQNYFYDIGAELFENNVITLHQTQQLPDNIKVESSEKKTGKEANDSK